VQQLVFGECVGQRLEVAAGSDVQRVRIFWLNERVVRRQFEVPVCRTEDEVSVAAQPLGAQVRGIAIWGKVVPVRRELCPCRVVGAEARVEIGGPHHTGADRGELLRKAF
jgi:hypothetical protein